MTVYGHEVRECFPSPLGRADTVVVFPRVPSARRLLLPRLSCSVSGRSRRLEFTAPQPGTPGG